MHCVTDRKFLVLRGNRVKLRISIPPLVLHILVVVFIVLGVEAVEDGSSKREDG